MKKTSPGEKKIIIIGAGPIGCYTAQLLTHYGFSPLLLEEHAEVGLPVSCAGIVGRNVFEDMLLPISKKSILNSIDGAKVSYSSGAFLLRRPQVAYIIDRAKFDQELSKGLNIKTNVRFLETEPKGEGYTVKTSAGDFYADILIGADGPNSKIRKALSFQSNMRLYKGLQYRVKVEVADRDRVEVNYVKPFSLFTWLIPEGNGVVRVGTICDTPLQELDNFMQKRGLQGREIIEKNAGPIPIGTCQLVKDKNAALVGDAACQVKPITSGGIYYGMKAAEILAKAIDEDNLPAYELRWEEEFGQEIRLCLLARFITESMGEEVLSKVFGFIKDNATLIEKIGDFENHSSVFWSLITNPRTYPTIGAVAMEVIKKPRILMRLLKRK